MTLKKVNYGSPKNGSTSSTYAKGAIIDLSIQDGKSLSALFAGTFTLVASIKHGFYPHYKKGISDEEKKQVDKDWRSHGYVRRDCIMHFDTEEARDAAKDILIKMEPTDIRNAMQDKTLHLIAQDIQKSPSIAAEESINTEEKIAPVAPPPAEPI